MLALKLLLYVITAGSAGCVVLLDYFVRDGRTRRFKVTRGILLIVSGVGFVVGITAIVFDEMDHRREVSTLTDELHVLRGAAERTAAILTGGSGYPYLVIDDETVLIVNDGQYPLYDVSVRMWEPRNYVGLKSTTDFMRLEQLALHANIPSLAPHSAHTIGSVRLPRKGVRKLEATLLCRNGDFSEQIVLAFTSGAWQRAWRVFRGMSRTSVPLLQRVDPSFPRSQNGEPNWDLAD